VDERARRDFTEFVAARSPELIRLAYVLAGDQHAAEDLLQSALTKAAAHGGRIHRAPGGLRAADHVPGAGRRLAAPRPAARDNFGAGA
jgi:DNA-directed RNA polymerase specialized sigma24 family protein